ncbi:MAG: DUF349 domain-containing protein [Capnocytophaga sp.]|nr:DUF349 domain-containing protein [Capnocytophaga sp.]
MSEEEKKLLQDTEGTLGEATPLEETANSNEIATDETVTIIDEIVKENAEDAEDSDNPKRHEIPMDDYEAMSMEGLTSALKKLLREEKVQAIRKQAEAIRHEFDRQYMAALEEKKEEFLSEGGSDIDFSYHNPLKKAFYDVFDEYRDKRNSYQKQLEESLQANLARKQDIIEEIKSLVNTDVEDINATYNKFKVLREQWFKIGAVPRANYNDLWNNYQHHVEKFYDFLELNRDLRDMDFKHNLEEKRKIVEKAEALALENDATKAFRELQLLHKVWKEDLGPVAREYREEIWNRFSEATRKIHQARQHYLQNMDKILEENAVVKNDIIQKIKEINERDLSAHGKWQRAIKEYETLREAFFQAGKSPTRLSEEIWHRFREASAAFNRKKNIFYRNLKKEQQTNLDRKMELIEIAKANKESEDWEVITPLMKKIQDDWKEIGHVPRKLSDKIWKEFKAHCNYYFDRLNASRKSKQSAGAASFDKKSMLLDQVKEYNLSGDREKDLQTLQQYTEQWESYGKIHPSKRAVETKFNKIMDALYKKLNFDKQEIELMRYHTKLERIANEDSNQSLYQEMQFVRRKIDEIKSEVLQLENNLQFFSNVDEKNPLVRDVIKNIENQKETLNTWITKLRELRQLQSAQEASAEDESE